MREKSAMATKPKKTTGAKTARSTATKSKSTAARKAVPKGRNLVICCDGTGNEIKVDESNILRLHRLLTDTDDQLAFYDAGVGTIASSSAWGRWKNQAKGVFGMATGYGLDTNILDAYRFLIRNHEPGDHIYLFGFSRGAYTVRLLAAFINLVGILKPHQEHMAEYALTAYTNATENDDNKIAWRVQKALKTKPANIHFMGCFDTVGSVIVPKRDRILYWPTTENPAQAKANTAVKIFRQAAAIDEKRSMFRLLPWDKDQKFKPNVYMKDDDPSLPAQDSKQVWFAGVHSDIGGGYPEREAGAAKIALGWMLDEAETHGLDIRKKLRSWMVDGVDSNGAGTEYSKPLPNSPLHDSFNWAWSLLEYWPKNKKRKDNPAERGERGWYLPRKEPRHIEPDADIHPSVWKRWDADPNYRPENLPPRGD